MTLLVHLGAGIGNVVLATPLLVALHELGWTVDVLLAADYPETADLLRPWSVVREVFTQANAVDLRVYDRTVPALPPYYARRYGRALGAFSCPLARPSDALFYENEQQFYLRFAQSLGWGGKAPFPSLPICATGGGEITAGTVVLAPGCKTGEMTAKRWLHFPELSEELDDVLIVGTEDDLRRADGSRLSFPPHVGSLAGQLSLRQTAELMAGAGLVIGNDSGLSHVAAAVGAPTLMIFGPTPHASLGTMPPNVRVLRSGLRCEPCWFGDRLRACDGRIDCLAGLDLEAVLREVEMLCPWARKRSGSLSQSHPAGVIETIGA